MKKYLFISILGLFFGSIYSQDINDALRYSQTNINGTARFRAMGGAFTALGGDLSAISINPASSVVFTNNQMGFTLSNYNIKNKSEYFGGKSSKNENDVDINQAGAVWIFEDYNIENKWGKFAFSVNYDNMSPFIDNNSSRGVNPNNSIGNYFLNQANGIPLDLLQTKSGETSSNLYTSLGEFYGNQHQLAFLGYDTYLLEAVDPANLNNTQYFSNVPKGSYNQIIYNDKEGYNGKFAFNLATEYDNKLYFGLNLNAHSVDYEQVMTFMETNSNPKNTTGETIREVRYQTNLRTRGSGFSFQLGGIARITDDFRVGLTYQSPTWYRLEDELIQRISTRRENNANSGFFNASFNEGIVNIYPKYKLQSPAKYSLGLAYIFENIGLISVDYSLKDYSTTKLKPETEDFFRFQNDLMSDVLDTTSEVRVGVERKIKQWSLRAGYNYEQSPYKNGKTIGDLQQYSVGFGYNFGSTKLDLAYSRSDREYNQSLFNTGLTDTSKIKMTTDNVFLTLLFEF